jgi:hypothetical protein
MMGLFFGIDIDVKVNFKHVQTYVNLILAKLKLLRMISLRIKDFN